MSTVNDYFAVEQTDDVWTIRFAPLDCMVFQQLEATEAMFGLLAEVESQHIKVIRADFPAGSLSPDIVEQFWHDAQHAPLVAGARHEPPLPALVRNAGTALPRLIKRLRSLTTLCITSLQGEVDFDLFGVILASHYRICAEDTVIVNRVLDRDAGPGTAMFWLLSRYLGHGAANSILMEGKSLTAEEALDLRLVNRVVRAADLETNAVATAEQFAQRPPRALASLIRAANHLDADLATYLERIGSGFSF